MVFQQTLKKHLFITILILLCSFSVFAQQKKTNKRPTVGLVLSGGGAKGLAHIGVLKVLEEAGVPVDFIGGTSMGSIVAGLYAIGYSAYEIEQIVISQDWVSLLTDQLTRTNLSVTEKQDYDKFILSVPVEGYRLKLPSGLGAGQNVSLLLSRLLLPVAEVNDFSGFPRPFLCVATDIVTGEEVIIQQGYLPDAIRASMAIPTVFTPVKYNGRLLVDGGLVNNFPADRVKAMGADIIIGVNLGLKEYTKQDLENLAAVLEQSLFFHAKERNKENQELCNILISPKVYSSSAASFSDVRELILAGEEEARRNIKKLKKLADSLKTFGSIQQIARVEPYDTLFVKEIEYEGLENVTENFLQGKMRIPVPGKFSIDKLEEGIERAFGTQFFNQITYKTEQVSTDSIKLTIRVIETSNDLIRVGGRFDSQFKAQLLLNVTLRNKLVKGSKFVLDINLGQYPRVRAEYRINTGWKPRKKPLFFKESNPGILPNFGMHVDFRDIKLDYYERNELAGNYRYQYGIVGAFVSTSISNPFYLQAGASYEFSFLESIINTGEPSLNNQTFDVYGELIYDSQDHQVFPMEGAFAHIWSDLVSDAQISTNRPFDINRVGMRVQKTLRLTEHIFIQPYAKSAMAFGDTVPPLQRMFLGGNMMFHKIGRNIYSFSGLRFMESMDNGFYALGLRLRYSPFRNHFITMDHVTGKMAPNSRQLFYSIDNMLYGFGLSYGYSSIIGPIEIGYYQSNQNVPWQVFLNIGYWF
jgi:NTE family protein